MKKPTGIITSCADVSDVELKCNKDHDHAPVMGNMPDPTGKYQSVSRFVQTYPPKYVGALMRMVKKQCRRHTEAVMSVIDDVLGSQQADEG